MCLIISSQVIHNTNTIIIRNDNCSKDTFVNGRCHFEAKTACDCSEVESCDIKDILESVGGIGTDVHMESLLSATVQMGIFCDTLIQLKHETRKNAHN